MMNLSSPTSPLILLRRPVGAERCIKSIICVRNLAPWPQGAGEDEVSKGGAFQVETVASLRTVKTMLDSLGQHQIELYAQHYCHNLWDNLFDIKLIPMHMTCY